MGWLIKVENILTRAFDIFFTLLIVGAAIGAGVLGWNILGMLEYGLLLQIGGTLLAAIIGAGVGWLVLQIMKIFA